MDESLNLVWLSQFRFERASNSTCAWFGLYVNLVKRKRYGVKNLHTANTVVVLLFAVKRNIFTTYTRPGV